MYFLTILPPISVLYNSKHISLLQSKRIKQINKAGIKIIVIIDDIKELIDLSKEVLSLGITAIEIEMGIKENIVISGNA